MASFTETLQQTTSEVVSENDAVIVRYGHITTTVEFCCEVTEEFEEEALATEIEQTLIEAKRYRAELVSGLTGKDSLERDPRKIDPDPRQKARIERHRQLISEIEIESKSPRGFVTGGMWPDGDFVVRFRTGCFSKRDVNVEMLQNEINSMLADMRSQMAKQLRSARERAFFN